MTSTTSTEPSTLTRKQIRHRDEAIRLLEFHMNLTTIEFVGAPALYDVVPQIRSCIQASQLPLDFFDVTESKLKKLHRRLCILAGKTLLAFSRGRIPQIQLSEGRLFYPAQMVLDALVAQRMSAQSIEKGLTVARLRELHRKEILLARTYVLPEILDSIQLNIDKLSVVMNSLEMQPLPSYVASLMDTLLTARDLIPKDVK